VSKIAKKIEIMNSICVFLAIAFLTFDISIAQQPLIRDGCPESCNATNVEMSNDKVRRIKCFVTCKVSESLIFYSM